MSLHTRRRVQRHLEVITTQKHTESPQLNQLAISMNNLAQRTKVIGTMFQNWSPELLQELKTANTNGQVGTRLLSESDVARIWEIRLKPGQRLSFHRHVLNYFWTVLTAGIAHSRTADGSTKEIEYYPGDTKNLRYPKGEGMTHDLENVGSKDLLFVTVEFVDSENNPLPLPSGF